MAVGKAVAMKMAINVPDLGGSDEPFSQLRTSTPLKWFGVSGIPENIFEELIPKIRLSRYRAALQCSNLAKNSDAFIVSHLPLMTGAVSHALNLRKIKNRHLGFSFNFTKLPTGIKKKYLTSAFRHVDQFAVFSKFEQKLYAEYFEIEAERIVPTIWTQPTPEVSSYTTFQTPSSPFFCAIGGEGRDFQILMQVAEKISPLKLVVIARPSSLDGLKIPDNVQVLINIPSNQAWSIAKASTALLVPLISEQTCCGHITLVSAKMLGIPIITTRAHSTTEYVGGVPSILQSEPGNLDSFLECIEECIDRSNYFKLLANDIIEIEHNKHNRSIWEQYLDEFIFKFYGPST